MSSSATKSAAGNAASTGSKSTASTTGFTVSPVWAIVGTVFHVLFSLVCIYLTPFGRTATPHSTSFTDKLFDLLFTDKIADFSHTFVDTNVSFVGPALLATLVRPFGLLFDDKIRNLLLDRVLAKINYITPAHLATTKLFIVDTRLWTLIVARALLAIVVAYSAHTLRHALSLKFKSVALPRIYTALCLASAIPLLAATILSNHAFTVILLNLALAALFNGKLAQTFSLLTVNAVIFDSIGGSTLLLASLLALTPLDSFKASTVSASILLTLPLALLVTLTFDSLFYNKFIWPQGEILLQTIQASISTLKSQKPLELLAKITAQTSATLNHPVELVHSKCFANALFILAPVAIIYIFGRSNRYVRSMLCLYVFSALGNFISAFVSGTNALASCTPLMAPLLVATSISVLAGLKPVAGSKGSSIKKSLTYLFFFGIIVPALGWSLGRIHLEIASSQQATGEALLALNRKIIKDGQEGVPVRVLIDSESAANGYSRFIELTRNRAIYSTSNLARNDYFVASPAICPTDRPLKSYKGFSKINIKALKILETDQLAVFRASSTCPPSSHPKPTKFDATAETPANLPTLISRRFFNGQFANLKAQRDFISKHLGRFNHKKVSNSAALLAYLYQNALEQV